MSALDIIALLLGGCAVVYLVVALVSPERF